MSKVSAVVLPSRPALVDYVLLLGGFSLSLFLLRLSPLPVDANADGPAALRGWVPLLSEFMRLGEGVILLWPFFFVTQRVRGRHDGLTSVEWLWVIAWLGVALLTALAGWKHSDTMPDVVRRHSGLPRLLWYVVFVPSIAALALILGLVGLVRRKPLPWTHTFGLALLAWPVLPLVGILLLGKFTRTPEPPAACHPFATPWALTSAAPTSRPPTPAGVPPPSRSPCGNSPANWPTPSAT